ncbi:insulin-like growth factor-binding protein 3 isoform X1 [Syngnathus scovelli]|uniref:insulin-like growth factor-binding protein 3 isoform X1 n=1 Tax=Syngnathus scovelli TaxID=161590 RepID=UPI00210FCCB9|nr:insulin-like growth factor-binding protein 3 isoform X1 [Syngnathus scovelli]
MDSCLRALCATFVMLSFGRGSGALGPVIRCEPCDDGARLSCKPLPKDCAERVREPGCGCCLTCALSSGQPCGVYTGRCGAGLSCQHQPGETRPLQALLEGRGLCANATSTRRLAESPTPPVNELPETIETRDEEHNSTGGVLHKTQQGARGRATGAVRPPLNAFLPSAKAEILRREQQKRIKSFKMEEVPGPLLTDQQNFSLEIKTEPEYGPCRREIESILSGLKITDILNPRGFRIPNCDKKGFYKKKQLHLVPPLHSQCRPSKGRKRGFCWCVDKYGQPLPGLDGKVRGVARHLSSQSQ